MAMIEPREFVAKTGERVLVRTGRPEDAARTLAIGKEAMEEGAYHITEGDEFTFTVAEGEDWLRRTAESPASISLVVEVNGQVEGELHLEVGTRRRMAHSVWLVMNVAQEWRERGLGTMLLTAMLDYVRAHPQIERVGLAALSSNERAIGLYEKVGFVVEGRRARAIKLGPGRYVDEVLMGAWVKEDEE
jgi:RimJ/RimL family protein N-acetyltransferase